MNLTVTNTRTIRLAKKHSLITFGGLCLAVAVALSGAVAISRTGGGSATVAPAPIRDYGWTRTSADDWRTFYYVVNDQALADQILTAEQELQSVIAENQGSLPTRTIRAFVVDSPEAEQLLASMMAEALPETTSFIDLRYPPLPAIQEGVPVEQNSEAVTGPVVVPEAANVSSDRVLSSAERITEIAKRSDLPATMYLHVAVSEPQADHLRSVLSTEAANFGAYAHTGFEVVLVDSPEANVALNLMINELHGHGISVIVVEPRAP